MLETLSIHNIIIIDRLELMFESGFSVLTGETGAGKSILLTALGFVLGDRPSQKFIREGQEHAEVTATFEPSTFTGALKAFLNELDLSWEEGVVVRRTLKSDGRGKAFLNQIPVTVEILKTLRSYLVDVHGQFDHLFNKETHLKVVNHFAGTSSLMTQVKKAWESWKETRHAFEDAQSLLKQTQNIKEDLQQDLQELKDMHLQEDEEPKLMEARSFLMEREKIFQILREAQQALGSNPTPEDQLVRASRILGKMGEAYKRGQKIYENLLQALPPLQEAMALLDQEMELLQDFSGESLENVENRLFSLRRLAKKHNCDIQNLKSVERILEQKLASIEGGGFHLKTLAAQQEAAKQQYKTYSQELYQHWEKAAQALEAQMHQELQSLCLEKARFQIMLQELPEEKWGEQGIYTIEFYISTNLGQPLMPLRQVASGGELSRIMLALKVITVKETQVPVLIFDEIDTGMGGAVAASVGEHLKRLSHSFQVLAITHAPQVAAYADHHFKVLKAHGQEVTTTSITLLNQQARVEEIARMLSGTVVSDSARGAAASLLEASQR